MKWFRMLAAGLMLVFISGCTQQPKQSEDEISRVVFASGGCYGPCPVQVIDIDSSLAFKFFGLSYSVAEGYQVGRVTDAFWDTLKLKLESVNFRQLDTVYIHSIDDLSTEILIYHNGKVKHISGQSASLPENVWEVYACLMKSMKGLEYIPTSDTLRFPTRVGQPIISFKVPMPEPE